MAPTLKCILKLLSLLIACALASAQDTIDWDKINWANPPALDQVRFQKFCPSTYVIDEGTGGRRKWVLMAVCYPPNRPATEWTLSSLPLDECYENVDGMLWWKNKNDGLSPSCADCQVVVEGRNMKNLSCNCRRKNGQVVNVQEILVKGVGFSEGRLACEDNAGLEVIDISG